MNVIPPKRGKPFQYPTVRVINPGKGLNTLASNEVIQDQEASDLNNIVITELGSVTKSPGKAAWGTGLVNNPKGLGSFNTAAGNHYVVTVDGTVLKYTTASTSAWTTISGYSFTASKDTSFTQVRTTSAAANGSNASLSYAGSTDALFVWNGTDPGTYWDGTSLKRPGTIPSAAFSIFYAGYHIAAGTSTNQNRLYISDGNDASTFTRTGWASPGTPKDPPLPDNPTDVPGTTVAGATPVATPPNIIDIQPRDGDAITGLAKFNGVLIIFKNRAIYQMSLDPNSGTPTITPIITYLGAVSHKSIDNIDNDLFYLSTLGWFTLGYQQSFYNIIRTNELSQRIHPIVSTINPVNLSRVASIYQPYRFYSSVASGGSSTNNLTLVYDKRYDAWTKMDYIQAQAFTVFYDSNNAQHLLYADDTTNQVWEISESFLSDNGNAINSYWQSKAFNAGTPEVYKRWIDITLTFRQITGNIYITVYADNSTLIHSSVINSQSYNGGIGATGTFGTELWGGNDSSNTNGDPYPAGSGSSSLVPATTNIPYRIRINTKSRTLMFKVSEPNDINNTFSLVGFALTYQPYSHFSFPSSQKIQ